jgi:hypothetical protein
MVRVQTPCAYQRKLGSFSKPFFASLWVLYAQPILSITLHYTEGAGGLAPATLTCFGLEAHSDDATRHVFRQPTSGCDERGCVNKILHAPHVVCKRRPIKAMEPEDLQTN